MKWIVAACAALALGTVGLMQQWEALTENSEEIDSA